METEALSVLLGRTSGEKESYYDITIEKEPMKDSYYDLIIGCLYAILSLFGNSGYAILTK